MNYVYFLRSKADQELYVGSTNDLRRRLQEHTDGKAVSTAPRRPFSLVYYEAYAALEDARKRELSIKRRGQARRQILERIKDSLRQAQA